MQPWREGRTQGGRRPNLEGTRKQIDNWLRARHMRELFAVILEQRYGLPTLHYRSPKYTTCPAPSRD